MWQKKRNQFNNGTLPAFAMPETIWFVTSNTGKFEEAKLAFSDLNVELKQFHPSSFEFIEPQHHQLEFIAQSKLEQAQSYLDSKGEVANVLVEDAGLFIDALDGFPGVYSSYVFDTIGLDGIVRLLSHLTSENPNQLRSLRSASFHAVAMLSLNGTLFTGMGECKGYISTQIKGEQGFGFDPIFIPNDIDITGQSLLPGQTGMYSTHGATFGEVSSEQKNEFSHRKKAIKDIIQNISTG